MTRHADAGLAQRLERAEAETNREAVYAAARVRPESAAAAAPFMGGWAMFDGPASPITQCFALGLEGPVSAAELNAVEEFFRSRGAPCTIELCPHAHPSLMALLGARGYRVLDYSNVLFRPLPAQVEESALPGVAIRRVKAGEAVAYARATLRGFFGDVTPPGMESLLAGAFVNIRASETFAALVDGEIAGGGAVSFLGGVANCYGDATLEKYRGRRIQSALIATRLAAGVQAGLNLAMATTMPGSTSQRNYERAGFQVAYTRGKLTNA
jgi:GNAT superfamily N-acetyltransferase